MERRIFTSRRCLGHRAPGGFPERPERLAAILDHFSHLDDWPLQEVDEHPHQDRAVLDLHDEAYVERFRRAVERGDGLLDSADNPLSPGTWEAARAAVALTLAAADWITDGEEGIPRLAFAAGRPPGHHAERDRAMGFCWFCNVAVAAHHLKVRHRAERPAIYDFDVHHGNGTQHLLEERGDILYASTHQFPFYPGTGAADETGIGAGEGATVNAPLPAGSGDEETLEAFETIIRPGLERFEPDVLLLSAGFDAWRDDPLGGHRVSREGFAELGRRLGRWARDATGGRVLVVLEGGYDLGHLPDLVEAHLEGLSEGLSNPLAEGPREDSGAAG